MAAVNRKQSNVQLPLAFHRLQATQQYFCTASILPFDEQATAIYQTLVTQKLRIGTHDLQIAAIALAHKAILVTANRRHFEQVSDLVIDLVIEDWTQR